MRWQRANPSNRFDLCVDKRERPIESHTNLGTA